MEMLFRTFPSLVMLSTTVEASLSWTKAPLTDQVLLEERTMFLFLLLFQLGR